jgi:hypothetical protein
LDWTSLVDWKGLIVVALFISISLLLLWKKESLEDGEDDLEEDGRG